MAGMPFVFGRSRRTRDAGDAILCRYPFTTSATSRSRRPARAATRRWRSTSTCRSSGRAPRCASSTRTSTAQDDRLAGGAPRGVPGDRARVLPGLQGPALLAGDLNAVPGSAPLRASASWAGSSPTSASRASPSARPSPTARSTTCWCAPSGRGRCASSSDGRAGRLGSPAGRDGLAKGADAPGSGWASGAAAADRHARTSRYLLIRPCGPPPRGELRRAGRASAAADAGRVPPRGLQEDRRRRAEHRPRRARRPHDRRPAPRDRVLLRRRLEQRHRRAVSAAGRAPRQAGHGRRARRLPRALAPQDLAVRLRRGRQGRALAAREPRAPRPRPAHRRGRRLGGRPRRRRPA